jgi:hypothetical protein
MTHFHCQLLGIHAKDHFTFASEQQHCLGNLSVKLNTKIKCKAVCKLDCTFKITQSVFIFAAKAN